MRSERTHIAIGGGAFLITSLDKDMEGTFLLPASNGSHGLTDTEINEQMFTKCCTKPHGNYVVL